MEHKSQHGPAQEVPGGGEVGDGGVIRVSGPGPHGGHQHRGQVQEEANLRHRREGETWKVRENGQWIPAAVRRADRGRERRVT